MYNGRTNFCARGGPRIQFHVLLVHLGDISEFVAIDSTCCCSPGCESRSNFLIRSLENNSIHLLRRSHLLRKSTKKKHDTAAIVRRNCHTNMFSSYGGSGFISNYGGNTSSGYCSRCNKEHNSWERDEHMDCIPPANVLRFGNYVLDADYRRALPAVYTTEEIVGSYLGHNPYFPSQEKWLAERE